MTTVTPTLLPADLDRPNGAKSGEGDGSTRIPGLFEQHVKAADAQLQQSSDTTTHPTVEISPDNAPAPDGAEVPHEVATQRPETDPAALLTGTPAPTAPQDAHLPGAAPLHSHGPGTREELPPGLAKLAERGFPGSHIPHVPDQASTDGQAVIPEDPPDPKLVRPPVSPLDPSGRPDATVASTPEHAPDPVAQVSATVDEGDRPAAQIPGQPLASQPADPGNAQPVPIVEQPAPFPAATTEAVADDEPDAIAEVPVEETGELADALATPTPSTDATPQPLTPAPGLPTGETPVVPALEPTPGTDRPIAAAAQSDPLPGQTAPTTNPPSAGDETRPTPVRAEQSAQVQQPATVPASTTAPAQTQTSAEPASTGAAPNQPAPDTGLSQPAVTQEPRPVAPASDPSRAAQQQVPPAAPVQPARQNATAAVSDPAAGTDVSDAAPATRPSRSDTDAVEPGRLTNVSERPAEPARRSEPGLLARLSTLELAGENPRPSLASTATMSGQTTATSQADNGNTLSDAVERAVGTSARPNASPAIAVPVVETVPAGTPATPTAVIEQGVPVPIQPVSTSTSTLALSPAPSTTAGLQVPVAALAVHISRAFDQGNTRFQVRMDPPELGRVDIRLDMSVEGRVQAHLTVERPETLDLMMRDARSLEKALAETGLNLGKESLSFSLKDQNNANPQSDTPSEDAASEAAEQTEDETAAGTTADTGIRGYITDSGVDISV